MAYIQVTNSGNCNFAYVTGLGSHDCNPYEMMKELLTVPRNAYGYWASGKVIKEPSPNYREPQGGMYLFAQGSEDPVSLRPYAPKFKEYIEEHKLGTVIECPPVPNPLHYGKIGILFVWIIDHKACRDWWSNYVMTPWKKEQEMKKEVR